MPIETFNEGTLIKITATFRDDLGALQVPNPTPQYRIDDVETGENVVSLRDIPGSLASAMDIVVSAAQNAPLTGQTKRLIRRRVTVLFEYASGSPIPSGTEEYDYLLKNLTGIPVGSP